MYNVCETLCQDGSWYIFVQLTSNDKAKISSILEDGSDGELTDMLDIDSMTCTGAKEFDEAFPLPPPDFRLDTCDMLPYLWEGMMYDRTRWDGVDPVKTP